MASNDRSDKSVPTPADEIQRWTAGRKAGVVLDIIKGRTTSAEVV